MKWILKEESKDYMIFISVHMELTRNSEFCDFDLSEKPCFGLFFAKQSDQLGAVHKLRLQEEGGEVVKKIDFL